ncbi:MAG: hypothetical protein DCF31_15505 [Alphaproteobacteria bacterium]|nr:MAG: hypothetical protein DCF31_15505 [Alphaproteobacteria bacterium]
MLTLMPQGAGAPPPARFDGRGGTIGRAAGVDLVLPDPASIVSSKHCRIDFQDGRYVLVDTSTNGTAVNGRRLTGPYPLAEGDVLAIGPWRVAVSLAGAGPPPPAIAPDWHRAPPPPLAGATVQPPAGATVQQPGGRDALAPLLDAAGIARGAIAADDAVVLAAAGALLRQYTGGVMAMTAARAKARGELGIKSPAPSNNPLKKQPKPELALAQLLGAPKPAEQAVAEVLAELEAHQDATLRAMQGALRATLDELAPAAIRKHHAKAGDAQLWQAYEKAFAGQDGDSFIEVFARELAAAYEKLATPGKRQGS